MDFVTCEQAAKVLGICVLLTFTRKKTEAICVM